MIRRTVMVTCALVALASGPVRVDDGTKEAQQLATYLMNGWRSEREKLVSGKCGMAGVSISGDSKKTVRSEYVFDHSKNVKKGHNYWENNYDGWWLLTPEMLAQCPNIVNPVVDVTKPTDKARLSFVQERDPRCFGMMTTYADVLRCTPFDEIVKRTSIPGLRHVRKLGDGLYELEWQGIDKQSNNWKFVLLINERKGFTCERFQVFTQVPKKSPPESPWRPATSCVVEWESREGTWVPVSIEAKGSSTRSLKLRLVWEQVNKAIDDGEFTIDGLGAPPGTMIGDRRVSEKHPVIIGKVRAAPQAGSRRPLFRAGTYVVIALNILMVLAIIGLLIVRHRRARPT